jgi:hypothetical protein
MPIQGIKLVTGEELVANVIETDHVGRVLVKDPLVLRMSQGPQGLMVNFFPWTIIAEGKIPLEAHSIVARFDVPKDVEDNYIQNTTGLQIVSSAPSQILQG